MAFLFDTTNIVFLTVTVHLEQVERSKVIVTKHNHDSNLSKDFEIFVDGHPLISFLV